MTSARCLGTAVIDGMTLPITAVWFERAALWIRAELSGPVRQNTDASTVTVFGVDSIGCLQADVRTSWPAVPDGGMLELTLRVQVTETRSVDAPGGTLRL